MSEFESNVYICGTVKNCEQYLDKVFFNIQILTELFSDYRIIMAYDNSDDKTLLSLIKYKQMFKEKMDIIINKKPVTKIRTQNISNARNACLGRMCELKQTGYNAKYFIMLDMDNVCAMKMNVDVIKQTMDKQDEWDSVSFNREGYYDLWALSIDDYIYSVWGWYCAREVCEHVKSYIIDKLRKTPPGKFVECQSAFNGFAIYKTDKFLNCHYDWRMPKEYMKLEDLQKQQKILWNVGSISPLELQTDEPDCEHRAFHMMAIAKNNARIRISPEILFT